MNTDWQREFFSHRAVTDLWRKCLTPEQTRVEADFLERTLGAKSRLLDAPCGNGRHSVELAKRGCRVTGLDISADFIREATETATAAGLAAEFVHGDMRQMDYSAEFDGAFCFGNSFGYFDFGQMTAFLAAISRALKSGGRFTFDTGMAAESILPTLKERGWWQVAEILFATEHSYLADSSCLETEATFVWDGQTERHTWWHWVYTVGEMRRMLEQAGLKILNLFSSHDEQPYVMRSPLLIVVAQKAA